jgi:hypothetical protein
MLFLAVTTLLSISTFCNDAEARAGGRRSIGNKGSRSFSPSASPSYQQRQSMPPQQQRPWHSLTRHLSRAVVFCAA